MSTGKFCLTYILGSWLFYRRIEYNAGTDGRVELGTLGRFKVDYQSIDNRRKSWFSAEVLNVM